MIERPQSNIKFEFSATDALLCWALKHTDPDQLQILEVPYAKNWTDHHNSEMPQEASELKQHRWDWTYCSDYNCTVSCLGESEGIDRIVMCSGDRLVGKEQHNLSASPQNTPWTDCLPGGIDLDMLRAQEDILFYDELILYQVCGSVPTTHVSYLCYII